MLSTNKEKKYNNNKGNNKNQRILIVDDEKDILLTLQLILEQNGFNVSLFDNPLAALSNFKEGLYDLAILDIKMPKMDGFQLYEEIKKIDNSVKVCFITAAAAAATASEEIYQYVEITEKSEESVIGCVGKHQQQQQQQQYCELQKTMFLKKPISNGDIVKEVNRIINVN